YRLRIDGFGEGPLRTALEAADEIAQLLDDDLPPDVLVGGVVSAFLVDLVERMAHGAVTHVVQQTGEARHLDDVVLGGDIVADIAPVALPEPGGELAGEVHGSHDMAEAVVDGG